MLSFGHIRDGKNLDLAIRAMADYPSLYLIVAGKEQSSGQKPLSYYQNIARLLNVDDRCRWLYGYVPEENVGKLFLASDLVLLTYGRLSPDDARFQRFGDEALLAWWLKNASI